MPGKPLIHTFRWGSFQPWKYHHWLTSLPDHGRPLFRRSGVRSVAKGRLIIDLDDAFISASVHKELNRGDATSRLSEREFEVLALLGKGHSNHEVAETLDISPKTVATYKARISEKIGLKTTSEFVKFATDIGLT